MSNAHSSLYTMRIYKNSLRPRNKIITKAIKNKFDVYRDTPIRYMGYANEVGESFRAFLPAWGVPTSYGIAAVYVMLDTFDKSYKKFDETQNIQESARVAIDTCTWQMLASVFWPGSFIRLVVSVTYMALPHKFNYIPTLIGLATIPFIVKPIDKAIDTIMKLSVSKILKHDIKTRLDSTKAITSFFSAILLPPLLYHISTSIQTR